MRIILLTSVLVATSFVFLCTYGRLNIRRRAVEQPRIWSPREFRSIAIFFQVALPIVALTSVWRPTLPYLFVISLPFVVQMIGLALLIGASYLFIKSVSAIGFHYSPCFDSHLPSDFITAGPYRFIRHPIYAANLLMLVGVFLLCGSVWILGAFVVIAYYYVRSAHAEEVALVNRFSGYQKYRDSTGRFFPVIGQKKDIKD